MTSSWQEVAKGYFPSIPRLKELSDWATAETSSCYSSDLIASALGIAGYQLKEGRSVHLMFPPVGPELNRKILEYFHSCRTDAYFGKIKASWFKPDIMSVTPDLILWTAQSYQRRFLKDLPNVNTIFS